MGKLFTAILNDRLYNHLVGNDLLNKWQAGFLPDHRTSDQTFIIKSLTQKYINHNKKRLYACFVDFRKAFDLVWKEGLFYKLLKLGIGGKFYHTLKSMYNSSKVRIKTSEGLSHSMKTENGVRQGDSISPLLFNIFINDIPRLLFNEKSKPPLLDKESVPALLYADDLIILSKTAEGLQNNLNLLHDYCNKWRLEINLAKTNFMIMGKGKPQTLTFSYGDRLLIHKTSSYKYLGTIINSNGTFSQARTDLKQKGLKALFSIWKSISLGKSPPLNLSSKLFDTMVKPIALYNSDIWGAEVPSPIQSYILNNDIKNEKKYLKFINECAYEQLHLKFCKMLLGLKRHTSNIASRAEIGRFPLFIEVQINIIKYWLRLISLPENRLIVDALNSNIRLHENGTYSWISMVKYILESTGMQHIWINRQTDNKNKILKTLKCNLQKNYVNLFLKSMHDDELNMPNGNKLRTYRTFKKNHIKEEYLTLIRNRDIRSSVSKFRLSSHNLMIEKGRHTKTDLSKRTCDKCDSNQLEDEKHSLMYCPKYKAQRTEIFSLMKENCPFWNTISSQDQFITLMSMKYITVETGKFIHSIILDHSNMADT